MEAKYPYAAPRQLARRVRFALAISVWQPKKWLLNIGKKSLVVVFGIAFGALIGFLYWKFVGCNTCSCAITSNPCSSRLFSSVMGGLL